MNQNRKTVSTGPVTPEGKAMAAKNAITKGIFSKGYLPWEDPAEQQVLVQGLAHTWQADQHPERMTFIRDIEEADLRLSRALHFERAQIEAMMQSLDIAREFSQVAGMSSTTFLSLPTWFFQDDEMGVREKKWAIYIDLVQAEARHLRQHYSDRLVPQIKEEYANLFHFMMQGQKEGASFLIVLGQRFAQSAPTLNLAKLINEIGEKYPDHLIWAQDPRRYEILIAGIRARVASQIVADEKTTRYLVSAQNRKIKANQALAALTQLNWQKQDRAAIDIRAAVANTPSLGSGAKKESVPVVVSGGGANDASFTVSASA